jgi:DNA replication protein
VSTGGRFEGFAPGVRQVPVPAPLLASLLAEITDPAELRVCLRACWHLAQVRGLPKAVDAAALEADPVLLAAVGSPQAIHDALTAAVTRGVLLAQGARYLLNSPENRRSAGIAAPAPAPAPAGRALEEQPTVYGLYEANIGPLTPLVAEQLRAAEDEYTTERVEAAIREAVAANARNWRYIAAILQRWASEGQTPRKGRGGGAPGRHPAALSAAEYLRGRQPPQR